MSKELEVVKKLQHCGVEEYREALEKVEKILLEYEQIENAKPNEALEIVNSYDEHDMIEDYDEISRNSLYYYYVPVDCMDTIKQALIKAQEQEKVLEIIKKKRVNCFKLRFCKNLEDYNLYLEGFLNPETKKISSESYLTQEEYDVLKEVLCDE